MMIRPYVRFMADLSKMKNRIKVVEVMALQGNLYEKDAEDGKITVFDTFIVARIAGGKMFLHTGLKVKGWVQGPDGACANFNWSNQAQALVDRVTKVGSIDPTLWTEYVEPTFQEREAYNIKCEEDERAWSGY